MLANVAPGTSAPFPNHGVPVSAPPPVLQPAHPLPSQPSSFANPIAHPLTRPPATSYKPKTSYQATAAAKKDTVKTTVSSSSTSTVSWQSATTTATTTTTTTSAVAHGGHQGAGHVRPLLHHTESLDADDRPTELMPEESSTMDQQHVTLPPQPLKTNPMPPLPTSQKSVSSSLESDKRFQP
ncbi:hypothetical protein BGW38_009965, partial [Lunasporangiospora selenospora]